MKNTNTPLVSVIVPVYNVEKYLPRCLDSLVGQTYGNLEILTVDDGSTDGSRAICESYAARDRRVKVIHKANGGVSSARNAGLDAATGDYIGFVDSDDFVEPDMFAYLVGLAEETGADVTQCGFFDCYAEKTLLPRQPEYYELAHKVTALRRLLEAKVTTMYVFNKLLRRSKCGGVRFPALSISEDALYLAEAVAAVDTMLITNRPKYHYYHRPGSLTTKPFDDSALDCLRAWDQVYALAAALDPALEEPARMRLSWTRFGMLDKMYTSPGGWSEALEEEIIAFLRGQKQVILGRNYLTMGRRLAYVVLLADKRLYRRIVRWFYSRNRVVNQ